MPPKVTMHPVDHQRILYYTNTYNRFVFTSSFFVISCQAIKVTKFYVILIPPTFGALGYARYNLISAHPVSTACISPVNRLMMRSAQESYCLQVLETQAKYLVSVLHCSDRQKKFQDAIAMYPELFLNAKQGWISSFNRGPSKPSPRTTTYRKRSRINGPLQQHSSHQTIIYFTSVRQ